MRTSALYGEKNVGFSKCDGMSARTMGAELVSICGKSVSFSDFVRHSFMDGPLTFLLSILLIIV